jgi:peptidoglycan/LPS O-acetylase OafA/YrhL
VWWGAKAAKRDALAAFTRLLVIGTGLMLLSFWVAHQFGYKHWHTFRLFFMFFCGAAFWVFRARIPLNGRVALAATGLVLLGVAFPKYFFWVYPLTVPYIVLYAAYVPGGLLRAFNRLGDYSYGVYIYAFPVQQVLVSLIPGITPMQMFGLATLGTLPLAVLSWHLVEKPMLARKARGAKH